jgi:predicted MPP superfamily phosphohydrolase
MFHTIITLAYIIPNIYVFLRIGQVFINKGYKKYYAIIYLLIASIFPFTNTFSHNDSSGIIYTLVDIGNYILPFYLYLFLFILLFDILLLINLLFGIIPPKVLRNTKFKTTILSLIIFLPVAVVVAGVINMNTIRTSEYRIEIPAKSSEIKNLKIAFAADFHLNTKINSHFAERFVNLIETIQPDLLILGGDIVENSREDNSLERFEKLFRKIEPKYGIFTVLGNHDFYSGQDKGSFFEKAGIVVLCDSFTVIDNSFCLGGRYDSHFRNRKTIDKLLQSTTETLPVILIDHRPTEMDQVSRTGVDIQFSGHTHNGQLFPVNLITRSVYQLSWGYKKIRNTHFFVTSGIRLWGPLVRTTGKSEIMIIDIKFTN